jgi:hypothetical protein
MALAPGDSVLDDNDEPGEPPDGAGGVDMTLHEVDERLRRVVPATRCSEVASELTCTVSTTCVCSDLKVA